MQIPNLQVLMDLTTWLLCGQNSAKILKREIDKNFQTGDNFQY